MRSAKGEATRDEVNEPIAQLRGALIQAYGPKPKARRGEGGKWKMLDHRKAHVGREFHREELATIAEIDDWARRVRELRVEHGYDVEHVGDG